MKLRRAVTALCAALCGASVQCEPVAYALDPERSAVHFELLHFGTSTLRGRFGPVAGVVTLDRAVGSGEVNLRLATATVNTGARVFDVRLREPDLLASAAFPDAYFVATRLRFDGTALAEVGGEFTLRGVSRALSLRALRFGCRTDQTTGDGLAGEICGGDFEGFLQRSDFGMSFGLPFVSDRVRLFVTVQGRRR